MILFQLKEFKTILVLIPLFSCLCFAGQLTDKRDGQVYRTVVVDDRLWMAENLNFNMKNTYCYNGNDCKKYGRYYSWEDAKNACPEGWDLPTNYDFEQLMKKGPTFIWSSSGFALLNAGAFGGEEEVTYSRDGASLWSLTHVDECGRYGEMCCDYTNEWYASDSKMSLVMYCWEGDQYLTVRCVKAYGELE